jgi:hypothetical protein
VLARLRTLAEDADCAIAQVGHLNKTPSKDAYIRVANSTAFWNASRSVVLVTEDPDDPDGGRLIVQRKANYARLRPVERHRIEEIVLPETLDAETGEPLVTSRMTFVEYAHDVDAADVLAPRTETREGKEMTAARLLVDELADGDWHESQGIKERGEAEGVSERTLQRAFSTLGCEVKREGFPAVTYWRLRSRATRTPWTLARL